MQHDPPEPLAPKGHEKTTGTLNPRRQPFVEKLSFILEDDENRDLIYWSSCGEFFRISDSDEFARAVLPRYFRHSNWTSFVRQLNMYDFHKLHESNDQWNASSPRPTAMWDFKHEKFYRGATIQQLSQIKRKKPKDHTALHIQYADTMQMTKPSTTEATPSPPLATQTPSAADYSVFDRLEQRLDVLSSSFDTLIGELTQLRTIIERQSKTMSKMLPLIRGLAEPGSLNMQTFAHGSPDSNPSLVQASDYQSYGTLLENAYHAVSGVWDEKRRIGHGGAQEGHEGAVGPFARAVPQKRKLRNESPDYEKNQQRKPSEGYSLGFILHHQPQSGSPEDSSRQNSRARD